MEKQKQAHIYGENSIVDDEMGVMRFIKTVRDGPHILNADRRTC